MMMMMEEYKQVGGLGFLTLGGHCGSFVFEYEWDTLFL